MEQTQQDAARAALVAAVKQYAQAHYERGGWDYVVECWEASDIERAIGTARTADGAIRNVRRIVSVMDSRRREAESEAF